MPFKKEPLENRFDIVIAASIRVRELKKGYRPLVTTTNTPAVTAVMEVEQGKIGTEYLLKVK